MPTIVSQDKGDLDVGSVAYRETLSECPKSAKSSTLKIK